MGTPGDAVNPPPPGAMGRNQRYVYLVARLRGRQITMEEATELFAFMESAVNRAEAARLTAVAMANAGAGAPPAMPAPPPPPPAGAAVGFGDEFLMMTLLTMGANAGLLAAITRRMQEGPRPASPSSPANPATK